LTSLAVLFPDWKTQVITAREVAVDLGSSGGIFGCKHMSLCLMTLWASNLSVDEISSVLYLLDAII
jgi:hypothetical protein